jgi:predicted nucleic acid-binding protein
LFDTNVVLDALLDREPWSNEAKLLWRAHLNGQLDAHFTATALTDVFYVARKIGGRDQAWNAVRACLDQLGIISVGANELRAAAGLAGNDFEDNVLMACAAAASLDAIITRDASGLAGSPVEVLTPAGALNRLGAAASD